MTMKRRSLLTAGSAWLAGGAYAGLPNLAFAQAGVVKFGQSAAMTGLGAEVGRDIRNGIVAAFEAASRADGGRGPRFELITLDDTGSPELCAQNVQTLMSGTGVSALIGLTSANGAEASLASIDRHQMPLLGTASGSMGLRRRDKLMPAYHVRAGYDLEFKRMVDYVKERQLQRVGLVYLQDTPSPDLAAMTAALTAAGLQAAEAIAIEQTPAAFQAATQKLLGAQLDVVLFMANAAPVAAVIDHLTQAKYRGLMYASSMAGQGLLDTLAAKGQSAIMSVVVPRPASRGLAVVNRCQQDLLAFAPEAKMSVTTLEGYISGRIAVEAARSALKQGTVSKRSMREALANLKVDLGGYSVAFTPGMTQGSRYVELVALDRYGRLVG